MAGRPRDPDLEKRLLAAAWARLADEGYDSLSLARVAADAGAHRTDVYRRWPAKARLVTAALAEHLPPIPDVDTGSLYSDLRACLDGLAAAWSAPWIDGLIGLLADLRHDSVAAEAFHEMAQRRGRPMWTAITRAVERGEIAGTPERPLAADLLEGPLMHRQMLTRQPITSEDLDLIAQSVHRLLTGTLVTG
ncbi:TetR-like C-terminal domain-containing protein [Amycolatopsis jiangsuensis]|uniref:AcrR family transcriptional regulator n=1 Tax=Amycolatopsis jiangsuensis TaxID=1181879 RepID=A0A840J5R1_9PSEU|nr:TetR-like C-terminal domain-containing protein [Amycolatopsis jiangsuensis]MBB4689049.1 AcrR family transcriptional regulator [Amycolatopsis jiangsuensis]